MRGKKLSALLIAAALTTGILSGCGSGEDIQEESGLSDAQANELQNARGRGIEHARNFDITYLADGAKLVTDSAGRELLLISSGGKVPPGHEDAVQLSVPVQRVMFASPVQIGFLEALGNESLYDTIAAVTTEPYQWTIPQVQERLSAGQICYIGPESWMDEENAEGIGESILAAGPDLVFTDMSSETGIALCRVLDGLGIPYAVVSEERETDTDAYMEWLKFFGTFYDMDDQADEIYRNMLESLNTLYGELAAEASGDPQVVAYGRVYGGMVYTQSGNSAIAHQIKRVGAVYALEELSGDGAVRMPLEDFLDECREADILIYDQVPSNIPGSLYEEWEQFSEFKAFQKQRIYTFVESYSMNCVKIGEKLRDLAWICHPEASERALVLYQPLQRYY